MQGTDRTCAVKRSWYFEALWAVKAKPPAMPGDIYSCRREGGNLYADCGKGRQSSGLCIRWGQYPIRASMRFAVHWKS